MNSHSKMTTLSVPGDDFPYIVIEFFKTMEDRPSNSSIGIISTNNNRRLESSYDACQQSFTTNSITIPADDYRVYSERWKFIQKIIVIAPSPMQTYFSESLDHPHYSVHPIEYQSYLKYLRTFQTTNNGFPSLNFCDSQHNHTIDQRLWVINLMSQHKKNLMNEFDPKEMVSLVKEHGKHDPKRHNWKIDAGLASSQSQVRRDKLKTS